MQQNSSLCGGWRGTVNRSVATFTGRRVVHTAVTCNVLVTEREQTEGCARLREQNCTGSQAHSPPPGVVVDRYLSPHEEMSLDTL